MRARARVRVRVRVCVCMFVLLTLRANLMTHNDSKVRDIAAGEELCICYLNSLYLSFPERDERLQDLYFFGAEPLSTDKGLEALV